MHFRIFCLFEKYCDFLHAQRNFFFWDTRITSEIHRWRGIGNEK